ncbi:hypothetical protein A2856_01655 [Candidatus Uhrbacteria bacterium RIFCSPHIGHO2_01_FULL_63_20]|uniref:Heat-inducible transcription repressor HrcA C-terminal domain-containing protein n=1 Tax=Candidatus Uhrbacteria bacterium RIFCSPHIGHO2_01_FULL_63_20 TaxID=1802385 RepID=A0A1F7TK85_9BACT|nr:MAG: hypothetical protein A2856_01655 [Candidatus Uhrbacteria bacterium RIFCSPHIGHO2_01_FULL_63_20]
MDSRQETILKLLVEEYIATAEPVGSKWLCEKYPLGFSPATVRHELAALEEEGYVRAPHTSAGRIPTEKAFIHYLKHFLEPASEPTAEGRMRRAVREASDGEEAVKTLAKTVADLSGEMAIVAFDPRWNYRIGFGNLMGKPDFADLEIMRTLTAMFDRFDDIMNEMYGRAPQSAQVLLGDENPFGPGTASIVVRYAHPSGVSGILGLVGPMRMDYGRNLTLLETAKDILDESD